ncbi:outer membrane efflux protein [Azoarcus indigens]|uniref:Outer membrane efflux protein n=2 Tax=Azoarcus indigens TaxID=29545 RepID=A0A4R6DPP7_9RHOO|nr:outer membrane efflux protein [Azoarcus indigens]
MLCCAAQAQTPTAAPMAPVAHGGLAHSGLAHHGLAQALDAAWQRTQAGTEAAAARERAAAARLAADSLLPAPPALELNHRSDRWHKDTGALENEVGLALPLWLPGQRAARQAAAASAATLAEADEGASRLQLAGEVREAAWAVAGLQAEAAVAQAQLGYLRDIATDVGRRVQAGELAHSDALAAEAEALAAEGALAEVRERLFAAQARWLALTGLDALPALDEAPAPASADALPAGHPALQRAAQAVDKARREVEVVRRDVIDAPELTVSYRREVAERGAAAERSLAFGLRLPFGGDARNRPLAAAAQGELAQAQAEEMRLRLQLEGDLAAARAGLDAARAQAAAAGKRTGLLRERASLIDKAFRAGEASLPELLLAANAAAQADAAMARQQAALGLARARLNQISGFLP